MCQDEICIALRKRNVYRTTLQVVKLHDSFCIKTRQGDIYLGWNNNCVSEVHLRNGTQCPLSEISKVLRGTLNYILATD